MQHAALRVHLVEPQAASLRHAQAVPEYQKQQTASAHLGAAASGRGEQLSDLERGEMAAPGADAPRVSPFSFRGSL